MDNLHDNVDPVQHERVAKALEQVNGFKYRYYAPLRETKKAISFDADDDDDSEGDSDDDAGAKHRRLKRGSRGGDRASHKSRSDSIDTDSNADVQLTFDDQIDRILCKTRTIALLKIANNTADILPDAADDDVFAYDSNDSNDGGDSDDDIDGDVDAFDVADHFHDSARPPLSSAAKSLRRLGSARPGSDTLDLTRSSSPSRGEATAAMRLVRTLSSFLSLPRVISYKDLEMITETLLNEPAGGHDHGDDYGDLIDLHVDSAREPSSSNSSSSAEPKAASASAEDTPIWKRRNTHTIEPLTVPDDPDDLELNFLAASSSKRLLVPKRSTRQLMLSPMSLGLAHLGSSSNHSFRLSSPSASSGGSSTRDVLVPTDRSLRSVRSGLTHTSRQHPVDTLAENDNDDEEDESASQQAPADGSGAQTEAFDEHEYLKWRTEVKAEYLAWLNAKLEAKRRRRRSTSAKKDAADKKPRWLVLYESSQRPEPKGASK